MLVVLSLAGVGCNSPDEPTAILRVTSTPEGAEVLVDGISYGESPVTIEDLAPGEHHIILLLENYMRFTKRIDLKQDEANQLEFALVHENGTFTITSDPPGSQVFLTAKNIEEAEPVLLGETPMEQVKINTGEYLLEISKENYIGDSQEIEVLPRDYQILEYKLKALSASIQIFSVPTNAQIWINDELRADETPAKIPLMPGEYNIGVYLPGHNMEEKVMIIEPNGKYKFEASLKKGDRPLGMVLVPEGEFIMGDDNKSPDERPMKKINLPAFYIDKYEVTNAQFKEVFPKHTFEDNMEKHPVKGITWNQAADYATKVGKRLPTEEEWEKAARGSNGKEYPWGAIFDSELAVTEESGNLSPKAIGTYKKGVSEYGCFDMSGNVYEWTSSWYNPYEGNSTVNVEYGKIYRVLRGGSYLTDAFESRSARRHYARPDSNKEDFGFRCAKDLTR